MRLTNHDATFLYSETASGPMHGASIAVIEGELGFKAIFDHIASRLHLIPRYRQRLAFVPFNLAHPKWVDDPEFDLAKHVKLKELAAGASVKDAVAAAMVLAEPLLPRSRPLWLMYVITGVPGKTLLLQMGHHAMVDGASGIDVSLVLFDLQPNAPAPPPPTQVWSPAPLPSAAELAVEAVREAADDLLASNPFRTRRWSEERQELLRRATESMTRFIAEPVITAPWNASPVGPRRNLQWRVYSFAEFREIRQAFGGTINDIALAVICEAAARYLKAHNENVEGRNLRLMCPVNVRRADETGSLGNRVSAIFPILSASPTEMTDRLQKVRWETEHIKQNRDAQAMELMMETLPQAPPFAMAQTLLVGTRFDPTALAARMPFPVLPQFGPRPPLMGFNFTCTNVPGAQTTQYLCGHEITDTIGVLMLGGTLGYGVAVGSYNQKLYFNFVCDPRLMPDLELMANGVDDAFQELLASARSEMQAQSNSRTRSTDVS